MLHLHSDKINISSSHKAETWVLHWHIPHLYSWSTVIASMLAPVWWFSSSAPAELCRTRVASGRYRLKDDRRLGVGWSAVTDESPVWCNRSKPTYCTEAVFCLEFCGKSRQKQPPYNKIDMELCPKDLYSLFESRLLRISTQIVSTRLSYSVQYPSQNTKRTAELDTFPPPFPDVSSETA